MNGMRGGLAIEVGISTARLQTLLCRLRFSIVVVFRRTNCIDERVIPREKRPNKAPLETINEHLHEKWRYGLPSQSNDPMDAKIPTLNSTSSA